MIGYLLSRLGFGAPGGSSSATTDDDPSAATTDSKQASAEPIADGGTEPTRPPDGGTEPEAPVTPNLLDRYDPAFERLGELGPDRPMTGLPTMHIESPMDIDQATLADIVEGARTADIDAGGFVASNTVAVEGLVSAAFDELSERLDEDAQTDLAAVEAELSTALSSVVTTAADGVDRFQAAEDTEATETGLDAAFSYDAVLDSAGIPMFATNADADPVVWNHALEKLTGVTQEEAMGKEMLSQAFYHDERRAKTLADKVLQAPEDADEQFGVGRVEDVDFTLYSDTSTMTDAAGEDRNIDFRAAPLYVDGEVAGVVEMIHDRTADARRHEETAAFVGSLVDTMDELRNGNLGARVSFDGDADHVDDTVRSVVEPFNELASRFETIADQVDRETEQLASAIDDSVTAADRIDDKVTEQREMLGDVANEVQGVSATMEEIAASSDEVTSAATQAREAASEGVEASQDVADVTDDLSNRSDVLVESVSELDALMADIEDIVEVISEVAEQTNMLALNANIEAARAGEAGSGFAVVADEVKALATETSQYTDEIRENIAAVQDQTADTVAAVEESHSQITIAEDRVTTALDALEEIADAVDEAASGIDEVAAANDEQADTVENITRQIEQVHEHAADAETAVDEIVDAADRQTRLVSELSQSVDDLSNR